MTSPIETLNNLPPLPHAPELMISDRCMAYYRRELERAKQKAGLNCEIVVRDFTLTNVGGRDVITLATILTDLKLEKAVLVASEFSSRLVATVVSDELYLVKCQPKIVYHGGKAVDELFAKLKEGKLQL